MNNNQKFFFAFLLLLLASFGSMQAQDRADIVGISLGRAFVASSRGLEAIGTNPANLVLPHREVFREVITEHLTRDSLVSTKDSTGKDITVIMKITYDTSYLVVNKPPSVSFNIPLMDIGVGVGSDILDYNIYKKYFTGIIDSSGNRIGYPLNDADKNNILSIFPSGIAYTHADIEDRLFGMTIHNDLIGDIGLNVSVRASFNLDLPRDYARFFLFGLDSLGSSYNFAGTNVRAWVLKQYSVNYARNLPMLNYKYFHNVSAGIGIKVVQGIAAVMTDKYNASFSNRPNSNGGWDLVGNFDSRLLRSTAWNTDSSSNVDGKDIAIGKPAGSGVGVDLGIAADVYPAIRAALSFTDIGTTRWTGNTKETVGSGSFDMTNPTRQDQTDSLKNAFAGKDTTTGAFNIALPTQMRLGASVQVDQLPFVHYFPGQLFITIEYNQGFNQSPGNTVRARFALGTEYRPVLWFPIRTGIEVGGLDRFNWSAGFGLDFGGFNWNFGTENIGAAINPPKHWNQGSFGMDMIVRI